VALFHRDPLDEEEETGPRRAKFVPVASEAELDRLFQPTAGTVLLFLHDPYCPISNRAYEAVEGVEATVHILDVAANSALGRSVQTRTGIRHESPQAIVVKDGEPAWHASHGRIRRTALQEALE
jgi:bacillithiol system protein YtxJ